MPDPKDIDAAKARLEEILRKPVTTCSTTDLAIVLGTKLGLVEKECRGSELGRKAQVASDALVDFTNLAFRLASEGRF